MAQKGLALTDEKLTYSLKLIEKFWANVESEKVGDMMCKATQHQFIETDYYQGMDENVTIDEADNNNNLQFAIEITICSP